MSLILLSLVVIAAVAAAVYFASQSAPVDITADAPEVPYIPIDGDVEAPALPEELEDAVEEATAIVEGEEKKTKSGSIIGKVKRSSSAKALGKAMSNLVK